MNRYRQDYIQQLQEIADRFRQQSEAVEQIIRDHETYWTFVGLGAGVSEQCRGWAERAYKLIDILEED